VVAYVLVTVSTVCHGAFRPTLGAMLPSLCVSPEELAGSNAARSVLDGLAALMGPLIAAGLLAALSTSAGFAAVASMSALSLLLVAMLREEPGTVELTDSTGGARGMLRGVWDGIVELRHNADAFAVVGLGIVQCVVRGALTVFAVIVSVNLTGMGNAGVGVLWAGFGVGGLVAAFASLGAAGSSRLGTVFGIGVFAWGVPLIICGLASDRLVAVGAFVLIGAANALVDVAGFTLLQRVVPDRLLARMLALAEAVFALALAVGSLVVPPIDTALGHSGALLATGFVLPLAVVLAISQLRNIDTHIHVSTIHIALLRRVPMLRLLPVPAIESLAQGITKVRVPAGVDVVHQGDTGDDFYIIDSGHVTLIDEGHAFGRLGPGDSFGEIALLRSVPRTVTVRAAEDSELAVLTGTRFVAAVTAFPTTTSMANHVVHQRTTENLRRRQQHTAGSG
jgi:hypothetical protein